MSAADELAQVYQRRWLEQAREIHGWATVNGHLGLAAKAEALIRDLEKSIAEGGA